MDEATRLVSELQQKLSELDHKVWQYRQDMASEFTKYAENVLRDVPKDVSETVSKAIAESMKGYKSLNPDGLTSVESCATGTDSLAYRVENGASSYFANSTTTILYQREDQEVESPRSSHEREKEFQGLFTPSYLPLLDSTTRNERRSSYEPQPSPSIEAKGKKREMNPNHVDASTDTRSLAPSPEFRRPPTPKRKNTDEWSVASDASDGPIRRSALRRSSSSSKGLSPRRVRFDVAGEEVLPTASPLPAQSILSEDVPPTSFTDNSDDGAGSEQVEDIDDVPPKRISSSQALRALSRGPFEEDGTKWTTVSAPPDGSASVPAISGISQGDSEEDLSINGKPSIYFEDAAPVAIPEKVSSPPQAASSADTKYGDNAHNAETPSDDEMLDMPPLKPMKSPKAAASILSPIKPPNIENNKSPTAVTRSPNKPFFGLDDFTSKQSENGDGDFKFLEDEHDELFPFDENESNDQRSPPEEEHVDTDSDSSVSPVAGREPLGINDLSRSPAREIPKPTTSKESTAPSKGVVGSYKGRPFSMPIVSDEIHAQAASLGAMNSFVGSVDGRSGLDESDVQSFRASGGVGSFSGTPKSMSERMMMDELLEAEEANQNDPRALGR
jgi:hypothetical protein